MAGAKKKQEPMIRYIFRDEEPLRIKAAGKADPQVIGEALERISRATDGRLTPAAVVDAARDQQNPLHVHFEWDDSKAAETYRLDQAQNLTRIIRVSDDKTEDGTTRAWRSIKDEGGTAYRHITEIRSSLDLQMALYKQLDRDLEAIQRRAREIADVCDLVTQARMKLAERLSKFETRAAA